MPAIVPKHLGGDDDDDWETDPDFVNTMSEEQQRWGGARDTGVLDMDKFREEIKQEHINETKKRVNDDSVGDEDRKRSKCLENDDIL